MHTRQFGTLRHIILASLCAFSWSAYGGEKKSVVTVTPNEARIVMLPQSTQTLIIGNPLVADVTLLKNSSSMVITGKSFGLTNMIALNARGEKVDETFIQVSDRNNNFVVYRGGERESYSCAPDCAPTVSLSDNPKYMQDVINMSQMRNGAAIGGASSVGK